MSHILDMKFIDIVWGAPFICLSIMAMTYFFDALVVIHSIARAIERHKGERDRLSGYLESGNMVDAEKLISSSKDPLVSDLVSVFNAGVQKKFNDYGALKQDVNSILDNILKLPHEWFFKYFFAVILSIGFSGTLLSIFCTFINFTGDANGFSQLFSFLAVGIKSSLFCTAGSILMATGHAWICRKVEAEREKLIKEDLYKNLICIFSRSVSHSGKMAIRPVAYSKKGNGRELNDTELLIEPEESIK